LRLHVFAPRQGVGAGALYSDAGDGYGPSRIDRYSTASEPTGLRIRWTAEGDYEFPYAGVEVRVHGITVRRATVDGREVIPQDGLFATGRFSEAFFER
jgi:alpha-glucosidase